jgi:hypothetical protein
VIDYNNVVLVLEVPRVDQDRIALEGVEGGEELRAAK